LSVLKLYTITLNGENISGQSEEWWIDPEFHVFAYRGIIFAAVRIVLSFSIKIQ